MTSYIFDPKVVPTKPGSCAVNPFCPPLGFVGSDHEYRELLRARKRSSALDTRRIRDTSMSFELGQVTITGPYSVEAIKILEEIVISRSKMGNN